MRYAGCRVLACVAAACLGLGRPRPVLAQSGPQTGAPSGPQPESPDDLLREVRANVATYMATLPDLFCDERFTSKRFSDGHQTASNTTVSTFRVLHGEGPRQSGKSLESRVVREIDGAAAHGDHIKGAYTLMGGFDAALLVLRADAAHCFDFREATSAAAATASDPSQLHIEFAGRTPLPAGCPAPDLGRTGEITLDAGSKQVLQIRQTLPHPPGGGDKWGPLVWTVTFGPVSLADRTFYTPASVRSELFRKGTSEYLQSIAEYSNYHKLEVSSRIVPPDEHPDERPANEHR